LLGGDGGTPRAPIPSKEFPLKSVDVVAPRLSAQDETVQAITDLQSGRRWVPRGTRLQRSNPLVVKHPEVFAVRYRLSEDAREQ
jgi:hypothetical protein